MRTLLAVSMLFVLVHGGTKATAQTAAQSSLAASAEDLLAVGEPVRPTVLPADEDCRLQLMLCNQVIESSLTTRDCSLSDGTFADVWAFPSYHPQAVGVAVRPEGFDALIGVFDSSNRVYGADSAPSGQIASLGAFLSRPGSYGIGVFSETSNPSRTGTYRMALACSGTSGRCTADVATLCLQRNRFAVQVAYENQFDDSLGFGRAIKRTDAAGFFAFGDPSNVELLAKILDFGGGNFRVFFGQLTNLRFQMAVTDTVTGRTKTYTNTEGDCGGLDNNFAAALAEETTATFDSALAAICRPSSGVLCLAKKRFAVEVDWRNQFDGSSGSAGAVSISDITGAFYFGRDASNLELVVKAVNLGDRIAFFWGTLSNLEYTITVTDLATGAVKTYINPAGRYCGGLDNTGYPP